MKQLIPVIVWTSDRIVAFGTTDDASGTIVNLHDARIATYWGTTGGIPQLAQTGVTDTSRVSGVAPEMRLHNVIAVFHCTEEAAKSWREAPMYKV